MYYIYKMCHTPTGRIYIGQHKLPKGKTPENDGYHGSGSVWKRIFKAHPDECVKTVLEFAENREKADELERKYIAEHRDLYGDLCVNLADGGARGAGWKLSEETRKKISDVQKGRTPWNKGKTGIYSEDTRKRMSDGQKGRTSHRKGKSLVEEYGEERAKEITKKVSLGHKGQTPWMKGKKHTAESRQKLSKSLTGRTSPRKGVHLSEETKRKISESKKSKHNIPWNKGKTGAYSEEVRKKMSDGHKGKTPWNKGKKMSEEFCKKNSEARKGKRLSEETRRKMSEAHKARRNRKENE